MGYAAIPECGAVAKEGNFWFGRETAWGDAQELARKHGEDSKGTAYITAQVAADWEAERSSHLQG